MNGKASESSQARRKEAELYYFAVRLFFFALIFTILVVSPSSYGVKSFVFFFAFAFASLSIYLFIKHDPFNPESKQRFFDYFAAAVVVFLSKNLIGILPATVILAAYSVLRWSEYAILLISIISLIGLKTYLLNDFEPTHFVLSVIYLIGLSLAASKLNLITILTEKLEKLKSIRYETGKVHRYCANLATELSIYHEAEEILTKVSSIRRFDNFERVLANLLNAESLKITAKGGNFKYLNSKESLTFTVGDITVFLKPKHAFLLNDRHYRKKTEVVLKMIKPYLESFLAKSR
jgi:hypothetical protein